MAKVRVLALSGDIARVKADALITAINSSGVWLGGIDGVIGRVAGDLFHAQAAALKPLQDGQTIVARSGQHAHSGAFTNVVFVVDDLEKPLRTIVHNGLKAASDAGFKTVTLPTIRMGMMLGEVEKSADEAVREMAAGVSEFLTGNPETPLKTIAFVVYNDATTQDLLWGALKAR